MHIFLITIESPCSDFQFPATQIMFILIQMEVLGPGASSSCDPGPGSAAEMGPSEMIMFT